MRSRVLAAALVVLAGAAPAFAQASKAAMEKALIANENKINDAVAKRDVKAFNDLVASDAVSADMGGFMKVSDFTKTMDQMKVENWHVMNPQVLWVNDKTAVVTYTWMGKGSYQNQPLPESTYASTVWTERNGKWVAVFHQESIPAPPPTKKKLD